MSEVADVVPGCCETISFASGIINELSRLLHSTLETCLNSFQNSIPFLSRINKTNESAGHATDIPIRQVNLELNLKSFPSVADLTRHKYSFQSGEINILRSDPL